MPTEAPDTEKLLNKSESSSTVTRSQSDSFSVHDNSNYQQRVYRTPQSSPRYASTPRSRCASGAHDSSLNTSTGSAIPKEWSPLECQANLPALLNDPSKFNQKARDAYFTRTWGQDFVDPGYVDPPHNIPFPINWRAFDTYLTRSRQKLQRHERNVRRAKTAREVSGGVAVQSQSASSLADRPPVDISAILKEIPPTFISPEFSLKNIDTLTTIILSKESSSKSSRPHSPQNHQSFPDQSENAEVAESERAKERLALHLEHVENGIGKLLAEKAGGLFDSVSNTDGLRHTMNAATERLAILRKENQEIRNRLVENTRHIKQKLDKKARMTGLLEHLKTIAAIHHAQSSMRFLQEDGDYAGALELIGESEVAVDGIKKKLKCLRHAEEQFAEQKKSIQLTMQVELETVTLQYLKEPVSSEIESRLRSLVSSAVQKEKMGQAFFTQLKEFIDKIFREFSDISVNARQDVFIKWWSSFEQAIEQIDIVKLRTLNILTFSAQALGFETLTAISGHCAISTPDPESESESHEQDSRLKSAESLPNHRQSVPEEIDTYGLMTDELDYEADLIEQAADFSIESEMSEEPLSKEQLKKLERQRRLESSREKRKETKEKLAQTILDTQSWLDKCSQDRIQEILRQVSDRNIITQVSDLQEIIAVLQKNHLGGRVKGTINEITKCLVSRWHDEKKEKIMNTLNHDKWIRETREVYKHPFQLVQAVRVLSGEVHISGYNRTSTGDSVEKLNICGEDFSSVSNSCLILLDVLLEIIQNVRTLPTVCSNVGAMHASRAVTGLLNYYNKRSCKLIVGAEGIQAPAKLKNITARHMAVCKRSLELIQIVLPSVMALFSPDLPASGRESARRQLDIIQEDFAKHISLLTDKILQLLTPIFQKNLVAYEPRAGSQSIKKFCRQVERFHDALISILPMEQVVELLLEVHKQFKYHMRLNLERRKVCQDGSPQYVIVLQDLQVYSACLARLKALEMEAVGIDDVWPTVVEEQPPAVIPETPVLEQEVSS